MIKALLPAGGELPKQFTLKAGPDGKGDTVATFTTPKNGTKEIGRVKGDDFDGTVLAKIFPDWEPPMMVRMVLSGFKLPKSFEASATPEGEEIVLRLNIPRKNKADWKREKRVALREWDLSQLAEVMGWIKDAKNLDNG